MVGQGGPPTTSAPITGASSHPAVNRKELTPYCGIIPPARPHGQKGQLGMIHRFVGNRDPLASATSPENRVSKKSPKKSPNKSPKKLTVRPQLPLSPLSPAEQVVHERAVAAPAFTEVSSQNEGAFGNNLHNSLVASLAEDPMDIVTPEITVEVSELFEGNCLENASVSSMDDDVLFVGENAIATAAKVETPTEEASTQPQGPKHGVDEFFQEIFDACQRKRTPREPEAKTPEDILIDALLTDNYTSAEFLALKNKEMSKKSEPVQSAPEETIVDEEPNLDEMTFEEQYLYGIRQGLPNKGYPVCTKPPKETATKKPAVEEPAANESAIKEPAANKNASNESIVNDIFADESVANYLATNESSVNGVTNESMADYIVTDESTVDDFATDESAANNIAANQSTAHQNVMTRFAPTCFDSPYITDEQFRELRMHYLGPYPGSQQAFEEMYLRPHYMSN